MKMEFYRTKNEVLKKYIEGYYFISPGENPKPLHYWTFPNNFFIVSVSRNIDIEMDHERFIIRRSQHDNMIANFVSRYIAPIEVSCESGIDEVTIYFKPLGINQFIADVDILFQLENALDFNPFPDFLPVMKEILEERDRTIQQEKLENYWLSKLVPKELNLMEKILSAIESDLKIEEIAQKNNFSRQYLNKVFSKNIGKSPSEYRKIHRFRNAINQQKEIRNLTELSYKSLFYDQSHLIKDFKQLTNVSPYSFFKKVDTQKENIWLFI